MSETSPWLHAVGLTLRHPRAERDAVRDVHLSVMRGEILALAGPNGSGKSSLLAGLARERRPRLGRVELAGSDIASWSRRQLARRLALLPQQPLCPEGLTVERLVHSGRYAYGTVWGRGDGEATEAVEEALSWLDLLDLRRRRVDHLSGGERQRAWLARALAQRAEILLLDEPVTGLDPRHQWDLLELIGRLRDERGLTVVVVLHDLAAAATLADRIALMHSGRLYACGPPATCLDGDSLRDVFRIAAVLEQRPGGQTFIHLQGPAEPSRFL
jgi:iron complex transport system ATP-binding protein